MALRDAIARLQTHALALSGMKEAPTDPTEGAGQWPFAVSYVAGGSWHVESAGFSHALVTLVTEIHVNRQNLSTDIQRALPYFETFMQKILNDQNLNGTVDTIGGVDFAFGAMEYGGMETIGWKFSITNTKVLINAS